MTTFAGILLGLSAWFVLRALLMGVYTVDQNERAVKTRFGRALRVPGDKTTLDDPIAEALRPEEPTVPVRTSLEKMLQHEMLRQRSAREDEES